MIVKGTINRERAEQILNGSDQKVIRNNTILWRRGDGEETEYVIRLHNTNIITLHADDSVTLNSGGWQTVTTKSRINEYSPLGHIAQKDFVWYFWDRETRDYGQAWEKSQYRIYPDGRIE